MDEQDEDAAEDSPYDSYSGRGRPRRASAIVAAQRADSTRGPSRYGSYSEMSGMGGSSGSQAPMVRRMSVQICLQCDWEMVVYIRHGNHKEQALSCTIHDVIGSQHAQSTRAALRAGRATAKPGRSHPPC